MTELKVGTRCWLLLSVAALILTLAGCSNGSVNLVGKWTVDPISLEQALLQQGKASTPDRIKKASQMFVIEFKEDKTFSLTVTMLTMSGTYSVSGRTVKIHI